MKYSIVVPTYQRPDKLQLSLASATSQEFDDFEVIVSNNGGDPATEGVVEELANDHVRYVKTDQVLSMVAHWEFALQHARGDWVLMLCDDDVLFAKCLSFLNGVISEETASQIVFYDLPTYVYGDGVRKEGNFLHMGDRVPFTMKRVDSRSQLQRCFWQLSGDMPKLLNCAVRRELLDRIRDTYGTVFGRWAPDYSVGSRLLANTSHFIKTGPLGLWGENMSSYGSGAQQDPDHCLRFFRQFPEFTGKLPHFPYPELFCVTAIVYDTLCIVREELGCRESDLRINEAKCRQMVIEDIDRYAARGDERYVAMREQVRHDMRSAQFRHYLHPGEVGLTMSMRWHRQWEKNRERSARRQRKAIAGQQVRQNFENILEAAQCMSNRLVRV